MRKGTAMTEPLLIARNATTDLVLLP